MASLGKAFVEIHADMSEFPAETKVKVKEALEGAAASMNLKPIEDKATEAGERAGAGVERGMSRRIRDKMGEFAKRGTEIGDKIMSGMMGIVSSRAAIMTGLITTAVLAVGQLIGPALGLMAALPTAIFVAVAAVGTLKMAFNGVGDAISAAFGDDGQKLNEAMKKLAPAAREVVGEIAAFRPQLKALQQDIQQTFFVQLEGSIKRLLGTLLPTLRAGLHDVAADLGQMARGVTDVLASPSGKSGIAEILRAAHEAIKPLIPAVGRLVGSFITLGAVGGPFVASLSAGFANLLNRFNDFISRVSSDGSLSAFFDTALVALRSLGSLLGDLFSIVQSVFKAMSTGGGDVVGVIGQVVHQIALLFAGPQGQELLAALALVISAVGQILIAISPLLPPLAQLIAHVGVDLANALIKAAPLVEDLARWLGDLVGFVDDNRDGFEALAVAAGSAYAVFKTMSVISSVATGIKALAVALDLATVAQWANNVAVYASPLGWVALAIALIIAGIVLLIVYWDDVSKAGVAAWNWIKNAGIAVWNWLKGAASAIGDWFGSIGRWFSELPGKIGDFLASLPGKLVDLLLSALHLAGEAIGIGIGLWLAFFIKFPGWVWDALKWLGKTIADLFTSAWDWAKDAVSTGIDATLDFFQKLPGRIGSFLSNLPGVISNAFKSAWNWAKDETSKAADWIVSFAKALPGRLAGFMKNVGSDIVGGLKKGINSAISGFNSGINKVGAMMHMSMPNIPLLAKGAIVDSPTLAVVGERGPEVVVPLSDPARARQLAQQSGLTAILGRTSGVPIVNVTAMLGTGQILEILRTMVETVINGQATQLANGVRAA